LFELPLSSRQYIRLIVSEAGGNKSQAAAILGINRRTLYRYLDPSGGHTTGLNDSEEEE